MHADLDFHGHVPFLYIQKLNFGVFLFFLHWFVFVILFPHTCSLNPQRSNLAVPSCQFENLHYVSFLYSFPRLNIISSSLSFKKNSFLGSLPFQLPPLTYFQYISVHQEASRTEQLFEDSDHQIILSKMSQFKMATDRPAYM